MQWQFLKYVLAVICCLKIPYRPTETLRSDYRAVTKTVTESYFKLNLVLTKFLIVIHVITFTNVSYYII